MALEERIVSWAGKGCQKKTADDNWFALCYNFFMKERSRWTWHLSLIGILLLAAWGSAAATFSDLSPEAYLPLVSKAPPPPLVEVRGLWVTRFDWTDYGQPASPSRIDEIVQKASAAGFNMIFFQVRGTADAYYTPGLEPWAQRVSGGALGQAPDPLWDPLAYFVSAAHAQGIELHAYLNIYPVWDCTSEPPNTSPTHFYYLLRDAHGTTMVGDEVQLNGLQWDTGGDIHCSAYVRSSPASIFADNHFLAVATDLVTRYDIDGIHLDHIRYGGVNASCDPESELRYGANCFSAPDYADWQRVQITGTVRKFYEQIVPLKPEIWLTAAVWPVYEDRWDWGVAEGRNDFYQDSQGWAAAYIIDALMPMIYPSSYVNCASASFWTQPVWETLVSDYQAHSNGRHIVAGIGGGYCTFDEINWRIERGRQIGTAGHAIFSYSLLNNKDYWDEFTAPGGPHEEPALVPATTWRP